MTIKECVAQYIEWKLTYAFTAGPKYETRLRQFSDFVLPDTHIESLTGDAIVKFHQYMKGQGYSLSTVAYSGRILKNFFEFWQGRGLKILNPKEIIATRYVAPLKHIVTIEDFEEMNEVLDDRFFDDLVKKIVINLLWETGMRVSELCDLNLADITRNHNGDCGTATIRSRKTFRYNLVAWGSEAASLLDKYLALRVCIDHPTDSLILTAERRSDKRITTRTIERWIKEIAEQSMIGKKITPHSFRHGKAHYMLDNGANIRDVQAILRHTNPQSSFHYLTLNHEQYLNVAQKYLNLNVDNAVASVA